MSLNTKIKIFETGISEGIFSRNKKFYDSSLNEEDINNIFDKVKENVGKKYGFNSKHIFQALQKTDTNKINYPDGKYVVLDDSYMDDRDYFKKNIETDILIISEKYKNIVVGNQMADCPIVIVEDRKKGVSALSHCGATYINRELPIQTVQALIKEYNSNLEDLYVYIGSCAKKENYIYDQYPNWATNKAVWENNIVKKSDGYHIDMNSAIENQLKRMGIKNILSSDIDTITNDNYYSHRAFMLGNEKKKGQNFVGFFYN